jgi:hypothetical protein
VPGNRFELELPHRYDAIDFADRNWMQVYSPTLTQNSYLRGEADKVKAGTVKNVWLLAASPVTDTTMARVMIFNTPEISGTVQPTLANVTALVKKLGLAGKVANPQTLMVCNAQATRFDLTPATPSDPKSLRGFVVAVPHGRTGYLAAVLVNSPRFADASTTLEKVVSSLCFSTP